MKQGEKTLKKTEQSLRICGAPLSGSIYWTGTKLTAVSKTIDFISL